MSNLIGQENFQDAITNRDVLATRRAFGKGIFKDEKVRKIKELVSQYSQCTVRVWIKVEFKLYSYGF